MHWYYILDDDGEPQPCHDLREHMAWFEKNRDRSVLSDWRGGVHVSTVFLPWNHALGSGPPVLWETMIFGGDHDGYQERYTSKLAAIDGHMRALALVTDHVPVDDT